MAKLALNVWKYVIGIVVLAILLMVYMFTDTLVYSFHIRLFPAAAVTWEPELSLKRYSYDVSDPSGARFYNIILEEEALKIKPCIDVNLSASLKHSSLSFIEYKDQPYNIGDEITILVTMKDGYGKRIMFGGDQLRGTIENKQLQASAPCVVTDNMNGTHSVTCEAFWSGTSSIIVVLAYPREIIATNYRIRTQVLATRNIYGLFKSRNYQEDMTCHPNHTHLIKNTNYTELCNLTYMNSGMPFYCGKPKDEHLLCQDWEQVRTHTPYPELQLSDCEDTLLKRGQPTLEQRLNVSIGNEDKAKLTIEKPSIPCSQYNITKLWQSRKATGFFYNGKWNFRNCLGKIDKY
ncbi:NXPE family member 2-like [Ruditapes philippinarum]|uniref:NXPE family member 2-like n=1 Tax=Ruditapes philippinarum TaxID=129788 RepID=UPI00295BC8C3|nr:NXPE family member 2-like [Ruditapes philippinarum]